MNKSEIRPTRRPVPHVAGEDEARTHLHAGLGRLAELLAGTLGPSTGPVFCTDATRGRVETFADAATLARRILSLGDAYRDPGAMLLRGTIWRLVERVGDGGATAAVLLRELVDSGMRHIQAGADAMALAAGIQLGAAAAAAAVRAQAVPATEDARLSAVARAVTRDDDLAAMLGEMSYLLGPDAHLQVELYVAPYLQRSYMAGARWPAQIASLHFFTEPATQRAVLNRPAVAVTEQRLTGGGQVLPLLETALAGGHQALLLVAREISGAALTLLLANHNRPGAASPFTVLGVTPGTQSDGISHTLEELNRVTGATILGAGAEPGPVRLRPTDLGTAQRVEFVDRHLVVVMAPERRAVVQAETTLLRQRLADLALDDDRRPPLQRRLAALSGGVGVLRIGAHTEPERALRRNAAERAWKVLSAVQRGGVVPGAGAALLHGTAQARAAAQDQPAEVAFGVNVLAEALAAPLRQILANAGVTAPARIVGQVADAGSPATYDVRAGRVTDALAGGPLDAADVVAAALESAASGAAMALTTGATVYHRAPARSVEP
jgi:chaperonin GroEL